MTFASQWAGQELVAIEIGLDLERFWLTTPVDFEKYLKVYGKKKEDEVKQMDYNMWILGKYLAFSFHEPKKYPKKPYLMEEQKGVEVQSDEEMERMARKNTIILGGQINGSNS